MAHTNASEPLTLITEIPQIVSRLRATFDSGRTKPLSWRRAQLRALRRLLTEERATLEKALRSDLGKPSVEAHTTEIGFVVNEIDHTLRHLASWLRPQRVSVPMALAPARARRVREPLGAVLIISPWNYPVNLALSPLVGAIAAGNAAVVKPSELSPATSAALADLIPRYLDSQAVAVVEGGVAESTALLEQRFDHIFYTGNSAVARIVMAAAVRHLTPLTLELGGKSPAVVEPGVDLATTARRLAWGKFTNAGQTCVAPDYVLAIGDTADTLQRELAAAITQMFGSDPAQSADYGRIVNERHFDRLSALLESGKVVAGGRTNRGDLYIAPTVLADVDPDSPVMAEEIFGPILPVVRVPDLDAAIRFVNERDKPLALYGFTESETTKRRLTTETSSGGLGFGLPIAHLAVPELPFGGVGESGMGAYHSAASIDTFSHTKAVLDKSLLMDTMRVAYAPISQVKERILRRML
ncbi:MULTISPECIES: aldehyde dehydrogenase family protein [unclassified Nocardiopsis]|uniref:aldehyde dehydrogenase family protein n=1 Tax=unclassified Nocardiopsis TaxID=2649073 RepID=UPI00066D7000|nr:MULTISPECIES: aldehyde dehydrogenase family protein [unclassified Nocardiopsis]MBQ1084418.1 aldehyde dehydrogenase family protein [Nocardiopsis sp. B62]